jgi:hypothetical protein
MVISHITIFYLLKRVVRGKRATRFSTLMQCVGRQAGLIYALTEQYRLILDAEATRPAACT